MALNLPTNPVPKIAQNQSGTLPNLANSGLKLPAEKPKIVNSGLTNNGAPVTAAIGVKTKSPTDTIKPPVNTTPQPQVIKPVAGGKTTEGGTENTNTATGTTLPDLSKGSPYYTPPNNGTTGVNQGGIIGNLVTAANSANDPNSRLSKAYGAKEDLQNEYAKEQSAIQGSPIPLEFQQGRGQILGNQYGTRLAAAETGISNAIAGTGQQLSGNASAGSLNAPAFGVAYGTQVGQPSQPNSGITPGALGGVAAPANIRSIQDFTSQINTTQKSVNTLNNLASQIIPNMGTTGFNPTQSPIGNQTFAQYFANSDPAASAGIKAGLGELKNQISNVIASATGLTPTAVTGVTDTYDFTNLNPQQLSDFLAYINQYAQSNIAGAQKSISQISSGSTPAGEPSSLPTTTKVGTTEAALGTGATLAQGLISQIFSKAGGAVSEAAGVGLAASILQ